MKNHLQAIISLVVIAAMAIVVDFASCKPITAETAYGSQLQGCVAKSKTKEESQACRAEVDKQFGVDGGGHE